MMPSPTSAIGVGVEHDLNRVLNDLRDHLARHDKPLAFLFGAGTSCSIRKTAVDGSSQPLIPTVAGLTKSCHDDVIAMGPAFADAWQHIRATCIAASREPHIENLLSTLRMMCGAVGPSDKLAGLGVKELKDLEASLRRSIAQRVIVKCDELADDVPHRRFARWVERVVRQRAVEIFTVNYDVLIEHALECERIPIFDGFVGAFQPFFCADALHYAELAPSQRWTRLWKLHGSVSWKRVSSTNGTRVTRGEADPAGAMIFPTFEKYEESRQQPYVAFLNRLRDFLDQDDALLVVAGFSFGDEHINDTIFDALMTRPRTHVYALQFEEAEQYKTLEARAHQRQNLVLLGAKSGIIGTRRGKWVISSGERPPDWVCAPASSGAGAPSASGAHTESLKLGDFASFCRFLEQMAIA